MNTPHYFIMNVNRVIAQPTSGNMSQTHKEKVMSYEEKSLGSTSFFKCEACPYMALAEDDIKFHLFTVHPELAKTNGLADNIRIPCPGCSSVFETEESLRIHLRNHHKMGIKDVKKMVKSLVQIALKDAKLKKDDNKDECPHTVPLPPDNHINIPEVIEIVPDPNMNNNKEMPKGVAFITVDELQKMSSPNFEEVDPKEIIQEASINIVYSNDMPTPYSNASNMPSTSTCSIIQMSSVPPDLISSIKPISPNNSQHNILQNDNQIQLTIPQLVKQGQSLSSHLQSIKEADIEQKLGKLCMTNGCHVRIKNEEKLIYHRKCHQNNSLQCPECNIVFINIESLHTHLWKVHAIDLELPTCEICEYKTFTKHRLLNIHMKCHSTNRDYKCSICSKSFKNSAQLSKHRAYHNKLKEPVQCSQCSREFSTQRRLAMHVSNVHEKLKPFKCGSCEYTAARKEELKVHVRSHTGDKPYSCDQCKFKTADHNSLRRHKRLHTKEKLYKCKHCPYSAIQATVFASHMISKHPNIISDDVHKCPYCRFKTVNKENYVLHLHNHHRHEEGIQLLIEMTKGNKNKPSWTILIDNPEEKQNKDEPKVSSPKKATHDIPIEVFDCDSQQDSLTQNYSKLYSSHASNNSEKSDYSSRVDTDSNKDDNNSDCLISESSTDTMIDRHQYQNQHHLPTVPYENATPNLHFLNKSAAIEQDIRENSIVNSLISSPSPRPASINNLLSNFPIRLPSVPLISLKPLDKIFPMTKVTGPIIKPTQILPVPSSSNSPVNSTTPEPEGVPRKKPKISVKSNLILKGPDQVNMFHSQQKLAFKRLEDNERFGLGSPVTFNNLITTQFMQLPPEPTLSESPSNIMSYPQETMLESATPPVSNSLSDNSQIFTFNQQMSVNNMAILPPQQKIQATDPSYIKLEGAIKQNTQSPSLERMCNANAILNSPGLGREYKASPPLEDIHKNLSDIKNEVKSDFYNIPISNTAANPPIMDQYLIDNLIGEQFAGHLDLSSIVLPVMNEDQQNDVIEIDDNSDDHKLLPRYDMNFPLESLYLMHNDFHFLENDMSPNSINTNEVPVNEMNRMVAEVPVINQKETVPIEPTESAMADFPNFIQGKKDPMMNTSVKPITNKINVKNIELMKN